MENGEEEMQQKIREFIATTCIFKTQPKKEIRYFHILFLKFFFNAVDVSIDYRMQKISIWNSKPLTINPVRLFDLNEAIADTVFYTDLEETLLGCVESGHLQHTFYKKILFEFADYHKNENDMLSA